MIKVKRNVEGKGRVVFPKLMTSNNGLVVFFEGMCRGVLISDESADPVEQEIGFYNKHWDMSQFTDYEGSITIQNEVE